MFLCWFKTEIFYNVAWYELNAAHTKCFGNNKIQIYGLFTLFIKKKAHKRIQFSMERDAFCE